MIATRLVRELAVVSASAPQRSRKLSAASGLVRAGACLYVAADDENHIGVFPAEGDADGSLVRIFEGELPHAKKARKASKPDQEALTLLPAFTGFPSGALMVWGSGSRRRAQGRTVRARYRGALSGPPLAIDLSGLYTALEHRFPELNIEGAVVCGDELMLMQRGSRKAPENACIRFPLAELLDSLGNGGSVSLPRSVDVMIVELGSIAGIALRSPMRLRSRRPHRLHRRGREHRGQLSGRALRGFGGWAHHGRRAGRPDSAIAGRAQGGGNPRRDTRRIDRTADGHRRRRCRDPGAAARAAELDLPA
jgi:hypothetical protein